MSNAAKPGGPAPAGRGLVVVVSAVLALDAAFYSAVTPLLPVLQRDLHVGDGAAGLLVATYALGLLVAALPAGWVTARVGCRPAMVFSLALFALASAGFGLSTSIIGLDVMRALQGAAAAASWAAGLAWLVASGSKDRHGALIGTAISMAIAGSLVGPVLGAVAASVGRGVVFSCVAAFALGLAVVVRRLPVGEDRGDLRIGAALRALAAGAGAIGGWVILLAGALAGALAVDGPLRLDDLGAGPALIGLVFVLIAVAEIALGPLAGGLADRHGAAQPMRLSLAVAAALLIALGLSHTLLLTLATLIVLLPSVVAMVTPGYAVLGRVADDRRVAVAAVFGAGNLAWAAGEASGALAAGWLEDAGRGETTTVALAALALLTAVVLASVRHPELHPPEAAARS